MIQSRVHRSDVALTPEAQTAGGSVAREQGPTRAWRLTRATGVVVVLGLAISLSLALWARNVDDHHEHSLLVVQTHQAAAVLSATILSITGPLSTALHVENATHGDVAQFDTLASPYTGTTGLFASVALWKVNDGALQPVTSIGSPTELNPRSAKAHSLAELALHSRTFVVTSIREGTDHRVGYAIGDRTDPGYVVYAERAIPADREVPVETGSPFSDLDFATYLGHTQRNSALETTDIAPSQLPLSGDVARASIAFGDSTITLVAKPRGRLGGAAGTDLSWVFLAGGVLLTLAIAVAAEQLIRRRRDAEALVATIGGLYDRLDGLYGEQRTIAESLQRALLPQQLPKIPNLEIAARYISGSDEVEIGGDWYSLVSIDEHRFAFVVGDVSGKGIRAATTMARLSFTIRAYLLEGHAPEVVLEMTSRQLDLRADDHFATVLIAVGDRESGQLVVANAGHMDPLIVSEDTSEYLLTNRGVPLGLGPESYESVTVRLEPGSTFLGFTDGLIERRGEVVDAGLERLRSAGAADEPTLEGWLTAVLSRLSTDQNKDDIAVLALRWK